MALAAAGFLLNSIPLLFAVLFGLGVQATFFGPLKYAILPSHLAEHELIAGNGLVEAGTFLGILAGTVAGSALILLPGGPAIMAASGLAVAAAGVAAARLIPPAAARAPGLRIGWNLARETAALLRTARANRPVWLSLLGLSWFWVVGATLLAELPTLVRDDLHAQAPVFTLMLAFFSVGVGVGSVMCSRLLHGEVSARLVPLAALGLSAFIWDFGHAVGQAQGLSTIAAMLGTPRGWRMLLDLLLLAACGGLYSVPLYAILQERSAPAQLARMVAANNVVNALAMVAAAAVTAVLALLGTPPVRVLLITALATLAMAAWIMRLLPPDTARRIVRWYAETVHGVDVSGLDHLPRGRPAILLVDHRSLPAACFVASVLPGVPLFAVDLRTAQRWWARPALAAVRHLPLDPAKPFSARTMIRAVARGETLVLFPGRQIAPYEAAIMVARKTGAPHHPGAHRRPEFQPPAHDRPPRRRWFPRLSLTILPPVTLGPDPASPGPARRQAAATLLHAATAPTTIAPPAHRYSAPALFPSKSFMIEVLSMTISRTPAQEAVLSAFVANGDFTSVEEAARHLLDERIHERALGAGDDLAWAKPLVDEAVAEIERGEVVTREEHESRMDRVLATMKDE